VSLASIFRIIGIFENRIGDFKARSMLILLSARLTEKLFWFVDSTAIEVGNYFFFVVSVQLKVGPYHFLWVVDLVHDQTHHQVDCTIANYTDLIKQQVCKNRR
jgi:hypothetical protein